MQLDSLIKPALIHPEHASSEGLPLAVRAEKANGEGQQQQKQQQYGLDQAAGLYYRPLDGSLGSVAGADDLLAKVGVPKHSSPLSMASRSSTVSQPHQFTPLGGPSPVSLSGATDPSLVHMQYHAMAGVASSGVLPMGQQQQQQQHGAHGAAPLMPLSSLASPLVHVPNDLQPINTNLVIDNNMAETLVHYFCSLANNTAMSQAAGQGAPSVALSSPPMAAAGASASTPAPLPPLQHQALYGSPYDFAGFQALADDGSQSYL
ncbi:hypothetical protein IWQ56_006851 [Coemansia nantahalensis]|nr:hypothetical protein IWQ56_006851 [Coemansia nantahalensis]